MSPSPFAVTSPTDPASYSWEATDEGVAERFGIPVEQVLRFDLNTSPAPPDLRRAHPARAAGSRPRLSEYPPGDYRRLVEAAAAVYGVTTDEIVPGAGADEILDMCTKAFLPAGEAAVISIPTYAMYRVHAEQRGGRVIAVPRRPASGGLGDGRARRPRGRPRGDARLDLQPQQPHRPRGARRRDRGAARGHRRRRRRRRPGRARRRRGRGLQRVHRRLGDPAPDPLPEPRRRPDGVEGLRDGRPARRVRGRPRRRRSTGSPSTGRRAPSARSPSTAVTAALRDGTEMRANVERVERERPRLAAGLEAAGLASRSRRSPTSSCSTSSRPSAPRPPPSRSCAAGLVPRTFGHGHPLAHCLRVTVRDPDENDRLIAAAAEIAPTLPAIPQETPA